MRKMIVVKGKKFIYFVSPCFVVILRDKVCHTGSTYTLEQIEQSSLILALTGILTLYREFDLFHIKGGVINGCETASVSHALPQHMIQ